MAEPLTILVAARDEEAQIGETVTALRKAFPAAEVIVADDGSHDATVAAADGAGARVVRLPRLGKGQALTLAEREAGPGRLLLCDADLDGDLQQLLEQQADLAVAAFAEPEGGGFGIAKRTARLLVRACSGLATREPLSGQRALSQTARETCFPLAPGFGCEVRMTIDAVRARLRVHEVELPLRHRATGRDPAVTAVAGIGLADDLWSGPERGFRAHLGARRTTGVLKLVGIPAIALAATRSLSGALLVSLSANGLNLLDTRPGRALKAFLAGAAFIRGPTRFYVPIAVLLAPYDLREMTMLGDAGSNALGAVLGYGSVATFTARGRRLAIAALAGLTIVGETRSLGALIEPTPGLSHLDRLGRPE